MVFGTEAEGYCHGLRVQLALFVECPHGKIRHNSTIQKSSRLDFCLIVSSEREFPCAKDDGKANRGSDRIGYARFRRPLKAEQLKRPIRQVSSHQLQRKTPGLMEVTELD